MLDLISFIVFILVIALLIYRDKKNVKLQGLLLVRRTKKGRNFIDSVAKTNPGFWKKMSTVGVVVAVISLVFVSTLLFAISLDIVRGEKAGVKFVLPGPVSAPADMPAMLILPWWIWVIAVMTVMIPHELSHGIICRLEKIKIKSVGWILLFFIPGAFVEPDEKELKKRKRSTKLRVYAAGSFANIVVGLFILLVLILSSLSFSHVGSAVILKNDTPAYRVNLTGSIVEIDGKRVYNVDDLGNALAAYKPNDIIQVKTANNVGAVPVFNFNIIPDPVIIADMENLTTYEVTLASHPNETDRAYLGVYAVIPAIAFSPFVLLYQSLSQLLIWMFLLSVFVGLINLAPIKPLDGGLIFEEIVGKFTKEKMIVKVVSGFMLFLLIFNIIGPIIMSIFI